MNKQVLAVESNVENKQCQKVKEEKEETLKKEESEKMSVKEIEVALMERIIEDFVETHLAKEEEESINSEESRSSKLLNSEQEECCNLMMQWMDKTIEIYQE